MRRCFRDSCYLRISWGTLICDNFFTRFVPTSRNRQASFLGNRVMQTLSLLDFFFAWDVLGRPLPSGDVERSNSFRIFEPNWRLLRINAKVNVGRMLLRDRVASSMFLLNFLIYRAAYNTLVIRYRRALMLKPKVVATSTQQVCGLCSLTLFCLLLTLDRRTIVLNSETAYLVFYNTTFGETVYLIF